MQYYFQDFYFSNHQPLVVRKKKQAQGREKLAEKSKIIFPYGTDLLRSKQIKPQQILSQSLLGFNYIKSYLR